MSKLIYVLLVTAGFAASQARRADRHLLAPAPGSPFAASMRIAGMAVADVNNDGKPDLIASDNTTNDVTIFVGNGAGGFTAAPHSRVAAGMAMHIVEPGDFNRDGKVDLAVTNHDSINVAVLLGNGQGGFSPAPRSPFALRAGSKGHNHGLAVGDVNADGNLDLAAADQDDNSVSLLLGDGKGGFTAAPGSPFRAGDGPYPVALGDLNGDGKLDAVTPNTASHDLTILLGNKKGQLVPAPGSPLRVANRPYYVALGDLNGDHKLDLIASHDDVDLITVALNDGAGRFKPTAQSPIHLGARAWVVAVGDLDQSGSADIVAATDKTITVLTGDGRGNFAPAPGSPYAAGRGAWKVVLSDLNRDGKLDVVANNVEATGIVVLLGR